MYSSRLVRDDNAGREIGWHKPCEGGHEFKDVKHA